MAAPALPYADWGACPFEGCTYREWTARKPLVVYDNWKSKREPVARLSPGERVTALTGVVITMRPGKIRVNRDLPDQGLRRGDTILVYTKLGEGYAKVWFNGTFDSEFDISFAAWPDRSGCGRANCAAEFIDKGKSAWWAQVKLASGQTGWVNMNQAEFDGVDQLASTSPLTAARA